jgi:hypothetical protein
LAETFPIEMTQDILCECFRHEPKRPDVFGR